MLPLKVTETKSFMSKLFSQDTFDSFLLQEASLNMAVSYEIKGRLNRDFFDSDVFTDPEQTPYAYISWPEIRPVLRDLIKGKKAPSSFRLVLMLKPEFIAKTLGLSTSNTSESRAVGNISTDSVRALLLNIRYENNTLMLIPAADQQSASPDSFSSETLLQKKEIEKTWDRTVQKFLTRKEISFEEV